MIDTTRNGVRWPLLAFAGLALIVASSLATYWLVRRAAPAPMVRSQLNGPIPDVPLSGVTLTLSKDAVERAGIVTAPVRASANEGRLRITGTVEPNAYRTVIVTPIVSGRVTSVAGVLGEQVRRGETLTQVYSPELAEAQSRYLSARDELEAHERELRRTEKLVDIGSASRQELEKLHAEHTAALTMVQSLRSRLTLLGMSAPQIEKLTPSGEMVSSVSIPSPIDGVITERTANIGLNVDPATKLFTIVDLSTVWVVGNLYERDFGRVRVGSAATITAPAYPTLQLEGKVSYIDPQLNADTRTAQVRVEVPNMSRQLRLGMFVDMQVGAASTSEHMTVPRAAVQIIGDRSVVYLADPATTGRFIEREVQLGAATADQVEVVSGVESGDQIVTKGSFALRAERDRLGLRPSLAGSAVSNRDTVDVRVIVSEKGFEPARVALRSGVRARLTFIRTTDATCATEVVIPSLNIKRTLPLNQAVAVELTPDKAGDIAFACGMGMFSGTLVVR